MKTETVKKTNVPLMGSALLTLAALAIIAMKPFADISASAQIMLGGILIALSIWIFKPFNLSFSAGGLFLCCFALALGLKPAVVFSGFTQSAIWTLAPAPCAWLS